ncbi:hypothetical protein MVES_000388 [Malassezia vespertilionis]|uniref:KOW domain-containing protein n=1 Tax=Malassezia vespertilionis TaxID=2020962 RepID=A0A2N1JGT0_9BASI|nr:hypothetical protein MVES_000388 [Malassezia vespertilionis]
MASNGGSARRVLRSLDHMWMGTNGKFMRKLRPTRAQSEPAFVQPNDRIQFWNIVPGDVVKLRSGAVGHDEEGRSIRVPRLVDPEKGEDKGFSGNITFVPRPVHYSKVMLKVPNTETYASRIERSKPFWDKRKNMFCWKRFAVVKTTDKEALRAGEIVQRIEVPWPKHPEKRRPFNETMADAQLVETETWIPWVPEDPVLLPANKPWTTVANVEAAEEQRVQWASQNAQKASGDNDTLATPLGAKSYGGFATRKSVRPPPIAQPPRASELHDTEKNRLMDFATNEEIQAHVEQGGQAFAASDYLTIAPLVGPASGGDWSALDDTPARGQRDDRGQLVKRPSKREVDAMPLELLMKDDLSNDRGLKWRMRRWKAKQVELKEQQATNEKNDKALLRELDALA